MVKSLRSDGGDGGELLLATSGYSLGVVDKCWPLPLKRRVHAFGSHTTMMYLIVG